MKLLKGEISFWNEDTNSLNFVDLFGKAIYRYDYYADELYKATIDQLNWVSFALPIEGQRNRYLVGSNDTALLIDWDGKSSTVTKVREVFNIEANTYLNAVAIGLNGELITGGFGAAFCMNTANLSFYQFSEDGELSSSSGHHKSTIGLEINTAENILYQLDACQKHINAFDYNPQNGDLCKDRD